MHVSGALKHFDTNDYKACLDLQLVPAILRRFSPK